MVQWYQVAIDNEPLNYWFWHGLCRTYVGNNNLDRAIHMCELGIKKLATNPSPLIELSNLYAVKGDYNAAITTSMQVLKFKPSIIWLAVKDPKGSVNFPDTTKDEITNSLGRYISKCKKPD